MWEVVRLRAIATEDEGWRKLGEPLFPERWPLTELEPLQADATTWESSYQQEPNVGGGYWFQGTTLNYYEVANAKDFNVYMLCDPALFVNTKRHKRSDYTTIGIIGAGADQNYYFLDGVRARLRVDERADTLFRLHRKWRPLAVGYEEYGLQADVVELKARMERENYRFPIIELGRTGEWHNLSKEHRISTLIPLAKTGRLWFPNPETKGRDPMLAQLVQTFITEEWNKYPACRYDDMLDMMSRINDPAMAIKWPMPRSATSMPDTRPPNTSWMSL